MERVVLARRASSFDGIRIASPLKTPSANQARTEPKIVSLIMGGYFKPLRRKFGVVTLAIACVFAAGWGRGQLIRDTVLIPFDTSSYTFTNARQNLQLFYASYQSRQKDLGIMPSVTYMIRMKSAGLRGGYEIKFFSRAPFNWTSSQIHSRDSEMLKRDPEMIVWQIFGITRAAKVSRNVGSTATVVIYSVAYWIIVLPLTLLSAWLLISKPRNHKQNDTLKDESRFT